MPVKNGMCTRFLRAPSQPGVKLLKPRARKRIAEAFYMPSEFLAYEIRKPMPSGLANERASNTPPRFNMRSYECVSEDRMRSATPKQYHSANAARANVANGVRQKRTLGNVDVGLGFHKRESRANGQVATHLEPESHAFVLFADQERNEIPPENKD